MQTGGHSCYYASFTDDYTHFTQLYLQKAKSDTFDSYQAYEAWLSTQFSAKIKRLRLDRGGEYLSAEFMNYLKSKGTERRVTVHNTPEHNGVAERLNRTLVEHVRAMAHASGLPKSLWGEAIMHATWVKNRTSTHRLGKKTPYEMLYTEKPNLEKVPIWGCRVKVHDTSGTKLDMRRVHDGHWVGFNPKSDGHHIYFPDRGTIGVEQSIAFEQREVPVPPRVTASAPIKGEQTPCVESIESNARTSSVESNAESTATRAAEGSNACGNDQCTTPERQNTNNVPHDHLGSNFEAQDPQPMLHCSTCQHFKSEYHKQLQEGEGTVDRRSGGMRSDGNAMAVLMEAFEGGMDARGCPDDDDIVYTLVAGVTDAEGLDPSTIEEARVRDDWAKWDEAISKELKSLEDMRTWNVVECPDNVNIIGCKWVFKIKRTAAGKIDKYKACLIAKGYSQVHGIDYDETYAPVAQLASLRTILAVAACNDWDIEVFDFHSAFLNGKLNEGENLYMELPPSYKVEGKFKRPIAKLHVTLYGSKQGTLKWYLELCATLNALGLKCSHSDWGIFYTHIGQDILVLVNHIDDCTVTRSSCELIKLFKDEVGSRYKITDLGPVSWLLGMKVIRDRIVRTILLSQESYMDAIITKYNFADLKPVSIPMDPNIQLSRTQTPKPIVEIACMKHIPY